MSNPTRKRRDIARGLKKVMQGPVNDSALRRAEYSSDASNYRVVPEVVAFPRSAEDVLAAIDFSRSTSTPLTMRGAGTSVAGNAVGPGIVLDTSKFMNRVLDFDPAGRIARVEPGVVLANLQKIVASHGLRFGPDPSTHARCTLGGMIGNNACGPHSMAYGKTADNTISLNVVDGNGRNFRAGSGSNGLSAVPGLSEFIQGNLATLRTELGRFGRQVSGYSLEHLLPERGQDLAKALVGTEGSCVAVLDAEIRLVTRPLATSLVVLGYCDMATAADDVPDLVSMQPLAMEGIDARLVNVVRQHRGPGFVPDLPAGGGWLFVEVEGASTEEALANGRLLASHARTPDFMVIPSGAEASRLWRIREDGAGLAGRTATGDQAWPGWEDAAVPPEHLGRYLREFEELLKHHGLNGLSYGHFGDGCVHVRLDLPLATQPERFRPFLIEAASLVARFGGSISGEHGDGRARSELLELMYSPNAISAFEGFKYLFDPENLLNPGVVVHPQPADVALRRPLALPILQLDRPGGMALHSDDGDFTKAVHRCVGVGRCRVEQPLSSGFMCPSYRATLDETHSTRGRARVLQELANGSLIKGGFRSKEVEKSLDLCLSCKACHVDCPAGVNMATYKSEVLHQAYRRRLRPMNHYVLGQLPRWSRVAGYAPRAVNGLMKVVLLRKALLRLGGIDSRRNVPEFAPKSFRRTISNRDPAEAVVGSTDRVVLWADSFTDSFSPQIGEAMIEVLEAAGYQVLIPSGDACCGLTWISTGQLDGARSKLRSTLDVLAPFAKAGISIVGIEPSCTAVLRDELLELLPDDERSTVVSRAVFTLAEFLNLQPGRSTEERWSPPSLAGINIVAQPHCHQYAVMGYGPDAKLMRESGSNVTEISGCCGLAGNFGMERGHYDVSVAIAELSLLPALREAPENATFVADGFSCRTQAQELGGVKGKHLAEILAEGIRSQTKTEQVMDAPNEVQSPYMSKGPGR
jgi:FAD/FMN-containing dehydrogenase/Fe-S oxidoreductase